MKRHFGVCGSTEALRPEKYVALVTKLASRGCDNRLAVYVDFFTRRDRAPHVFFADEIIDPTVARAIR